MELEAAKQRIKESLSESADDVIAAFEAEIEKESNKKAKAVDEKKKLQQKYRELQETADSLAEYADEGEDQSEKLKNLQNKLQNLEKQVSDTEQNKSQVEQEKEKLEQQLSELQTKQKLTDAAEKLGANRTVLEKFAQDKRLELSEDGTVKIGKADANDDQLQDFETYAQNDTEAQQFWAALFPQQNQGVPLPGGTPTGTNQTQNLAEVARSAGVAQLRND